MNELPPETMRIIDYYTVLLDMAPFTPENREMERGRVAAYRSIINSLRNGEDIPTLLGQCRAFRVTEQDGAWTIGEQQGIFRVYQQVGEVFAVLAQEVRYETHQADASGC